MKKTQSPGSRTPLPTTSGRVSFFSREVHISISLWRFCGAQHTNRGSQLDNGLAPSSAPYAPRVQRAFSCASSSRLTHHRGVRLLIVWSRSHLTSTKNPSSEVFSTFPEKIRWFLGGFGLPLSWNRVRTVAPTFKGFAAGRSIATKEKVWLATLFARADMSSPPPPPPPLPPPAH